MEDFDAKFNSFLAGCQKLVNTEYAARFPNLVPPLLYACKLSVKPHRKYVKVLLTSDGGDGPSSVYCFVDKSNGDVLKSASLAARGNIFDAANGLASMTWTGPAHLR